MARTEVDQRIFLALLPGLEDAMSVLSEHIDRTRKLIPAARMVMGLIPGQELAANMIRQQITDIRGSLNGHTEPESDGPKRRGRPSIQRALPAPETPEEVEQPKRPAYGGVPRGSVAARQRAKKAAQTRWRNATTRRKMPAVWMPTPGTQGDWLIRWAQRQEDGVFFMQDARTAALREKKGSLGTGNNASAVISNYLRKHGIFHHHPDGTSAKYILDERYMQQDQQ